MSGFITLHRKILKWEWYSETNVKVLFIHCLLKANFADTNYKGLHIPRGSFVTGRDVLAKETGLSVQQLRTAINKLKSTSELTTTSTSKGMTVCVVKYDDFQTQGKLATSNQPAHQPASNQQSTSNQPLNNKVNKENNNTPPAPKGEWSEVFPPGTSRMSVKQKNQTKVNTMTATMTRISKWFNRKPSTMWTVSEALSLQTVNPTPDDIDLLENHFLHVKNAVKSKGLETLLNQWNRNLDWASNKDAFKDTDTSTKSDDRQAYLNSLAPQLRHLHE